MLVLLLMLILPIHPFYSMAYSTIRTIYVDDDNIDGPWDGSMEHPYQYIQDGINMSINGDTIFVFNGTYSENILVSRKINLQGEKAITTIIKPMLGITINILCNDVTIKGFTISNQRWDPYAPYPGIYLFDINNCTISENIVDFNYNGILIFNSSDCFISNNYINWSYQLGIHIQKSSDINLLNNSLCNNSNGMTIEESTQLKICNNTFEKRGIILHGTLIAHWNTHDIMDNKKDGKPIYYYKNANNITIPSDAGQVILAHCSNMDIQNVTFHGDYIDFGYSDNLIQLGFTTHSTISNNIILIYCDHSSIYMYDSTYNTISQNIIDTTAGSAIELRYCTNNSIHNNSIINNTNGIIFVDSNHNIIQDNDIQDNYRFGIGLETSSSNIIYRNTLSNNFHGGLWISKSSNNLIYENLIGSDFHSSIVLIDSSHTNILKNTFYQIGGIELLSTSSITINENIFHSEGIIIDGDLVEYWNTHTIEHNMIDGKTIKYYSNVQNGIVSEDAGQVILANASNIHIRNLHTDDIRRPIQVGFSSNNYIDKNTFVGCKDTGILLFYSEDNVISNNSISGTESVAVSLYYSMNNNIQDNAFLNNYFGVYLEFSKKNIVMKNNFISNMIHVEFHYITVKSNNEWSRNYWDDWIGLQYPILSFLPYHIYKLSYDWLPAKKPYDIP